MKNWDDVRIFLALAETGTIREAASRLAVTHVTVARRIRALEVNLGAMLFERLPRGHVLTDAGRSVLPQAKAAAETMQELERKILAIDSGLSGTVTLALHEAVAAVLVAPILPELRTLYPQISLKILLSNNLVNLASREADLALRLTSNPPETAFGRRIANSPLCVYAAPSYLAARSTPDVWIGLDYEPAHRLVEVTDTSIQANGLLAMAELLVAGLGVGVLPCFVGDNHAGLQRLDDAPPTPDLDLWLLIHKDLRAVPRVRAVADFIADKLIRARPMIEGRAG